MDSLAIELREFLQMGRESSLGAVMDHLCAMTGQSRLLVHVVLWQRRRQCDESDYTPEAHRVADCIDELMGQAGDEAWSRLVDRCIRKPRGRRPGRPTLMSDEEIRAARSYGGRGSARRWVRLDDGRLAEFQTAPAPQSPASST